MPEPSMFVLKGSASQLSPDIVAGLQLQAQHPTVADLSTIGVQDEVAFNRRDTRVLLPPSIPIEVEEPAAVRVRPGRGTVFIDPRIRDHRIDRFRRIVPRSRLGVPVAPSATPTDQDVFESPDGSRRFALPRYGLMFQRAGTVDEPQLAISDRNGLPTLIVTLVEQPSPAAGPGIDELDHALGLTLRYRVPVVGGGSQVKDMPFPNVLLDPTGTVVTAELPLTTPGLRQQLVSALSSLDAATTLVAARGASLGIPTGTNLPDGQLGYMTRRLMLEQEIQPVPLVLSEAQRARLGGGGAAGPVSPLIRHRIAFNGRSHSYWQDPARPETFTFLPDRFLLAREEEADHRPALKVRASGRSDDLRITMEFVARPLLDMQRLQEAMPALTTVANARGATQPPVLELLMEAQPLLRLALPQDGAPSAQLTERPDTAIDLESGLVHAETMKLDDFRVVYEAMFGASLSVLRGEIRVDAGGGEPEDVALELRFDRTIGPILTLKPGGDQLGARGLEIVNPTESTARLDKVAGRLVVDGVAHAARIDGLPQRLKPGETISVTFTPLAPLEKLAEAELLLDLSGVTVEPDPAAIWNRVFERSTSVTLARPIAVESFAPLYVGTDRPGDRVIAFVVTVENGGTVRVTETDLKATTEVRTPVEPLVTGAPLPPVRYRTETWWQSGGVGQSDWRTTDATILLPVKTPPA